MKVLNLQCSPAQHAFEGWFGSENDFQSQLVRGLIECPLCASRLVVKLPSAPRLNLSGATALRGVPGAAPGIESSDTGVVGPTRQKADSVAAIEVLASGPANTSANMNQHQQAAFLRALRDVVMKSEDVGHNFAEEARRMHYGESAVRSIRGQASANEALELAEEGIAVVALPNMPLLKQTLQ